MVYPIRAKRTVAVPVFADLEKEEKTKQRLSWASKSNLFETKCFRTFNSSILSHKTTNGKSRISRVAVQNEFGARTNKDETWNQETKIGPSNAYFPWPLGQMHQDSFYLKPSTRNKKAWIFSN